MKNKKRTINFKKLRNLNPKQKLIAFIALILVTIILTIIITSTITKSINKRSQLKNGEYKVGAGNTNSELIESYIKKGVTIGGVTGTLEDIDTSDATATPEDITLGKTAYVKGAKITGTYESFNTGKTVEEAKTQDKFFEKDTTITDSSYPTNNVRVPEGFKIAKDSATIVEDGIVIEDKDGNQFVWIPAKTGLGTIVHTSKGDITMVYKRTAFRGENIETTYTETMPSDEETSVNANGGYYIGRYETGDKESTDANTMRENDTSTSNTVTIKKGQAPYNYTTYDEQKSLAEGMKGKRGYEATTKLSSSYAWDTAISFIQIKNEDYGASSEEGNYYNTTFEYTDIAEAKQTKAKNSITLVPTGQTTPVCNIYDMGGNCYERTTERYSDSSSPVSNRGGFYNNSYAGGPAGHRGNVIGDANFYTFRVTLYL